MSSPALLSQPIGRLDGTPAALGDLTGERATLLVNVTFPMTEKVEVNGAGRHPVYVDLVQVPDQSGRVGDVQWNFEKVPPRRERCRRRPVRPDSRTR